MIISRIITIIMITPDEELAEPVLALSKEEAEEVKEDPSLLALLGWRSIAGIVGRD